jgi:predicted nuclease of predicted toxin-antitoxin system
MRELRAWPGKQIGEVRRFAIETDRILVTLDADFGNLIRFSPSGSLLLLDSSPDPKLVFLDNGKLSMKINLAEPIEP